MDIEVLFKNQKLIAQQQGNYVYLINGLNEIVVRLENEVFLRLKEQERIMV